MKNTKAIRGSFIAKFFNSFLFIISLFIAIFTFVCIIFLTICGAFDSSRDASINSMRDVLYNKVCQNYCYDALDLCVFGDKNDNIFDDTNFRFVIKSDVGITTLTTRKSSDGEYIYQTTFDFPYPVERKEFLLDETTVTTYIDYKLYSITGYIDGNLTAEDQFAFLNNFVQMIYQLRYAIILLCILTVAISIISFLFLMSSAGYHDADETPRLSWFDRIFLELILGAFLGIVILELLLIDSLSIFSISTTIWLVFIVLVDIALFLLISTSFATRVHCKHFWKSTLVYTILKGLYHLIKNTVLAFAKLLSLIPMIWQVILFIGVLCLTELFLMALWGEEDFVLIFILEKLVMIPLVLYITIMFKKLEETTKKIASGDMSATVNTTYFLGTLKNQGEHLNSIKIGISQAVEDKMRSERFKTELITNVSHDIKTPLTSIINYVDLLGKEDLQNETAKEYIQIISKHSDRLKKLVVDLVDASKASSGVIKLDMKPLKIDVLLEQIGGEYNERLSENHLDLIMRKPEESMEIMADGQRIYRVFDNLMNNICKYALPGTRVYLLLEKNENNAIITFKNISATELDMSASDLMERFVRGDSSRNTEGCGLGLSIAESLVNLQKGTFHIQLDGDLFKVIIKFPLI